MLDAGNGLAVIGLRAGRDQNMFGAHRLAGRGQAHRMRIFDHSAAGNEHGARLGEVRRIGSLKTRDFLGLFGDQCRTVQQGVRHSPATTRPTRVIDTDTLTECLIAKSAPTA